MHSNEELQITWNRTEPKNIRVKGYEPWPIIWELILKKFPNFFLLAF